MIGRPALDLIGKRFVRVLVLSRAGRGRHNHILWNCLCDCGKSFVTKGYALNCGSVKSCGCLEIESRFLSANKASSHGHCRRHKTTAEYRTWQAMKQRCGYKAHKHYKSYGGRGIRVCARWAKFENFLADMGPRPIGKSLDRFPNPDGNYEPSNCRWATDKEQRNNRSKKKKAGAG